MADRNIQEIVNHAVDRALRKVLPAIRRELAATSKLGDRHTSPRVGRRGGRKTRPRVEMTNWVADTRARRVPKFVIEATGLDTKKKIVAKFGENAAFAKGKPLPPAKLRTAPANGAARVVKARPPVVRKAAAK
jgi:hypothetical protein